MYILAAKGRYVRLDNLHHQGEAEALKEEILGEFGGSKISFFLRCMLCLFCCAYVQIQYTFPTKKL